MSIKTNKLDIEKDYQYRILITEDVDKSKQKQPLVERVSILRIFSKIISIVLTFIICLLAYDFLSIYLKSIYGKDDTSENLLDDQTNSMPLMASLLVD